MQLRGEAPNQDVIDVAPVEGVDDRYRIKAAFSHADVAVRIRLCFADATSARSRVTRSDW